MLIVGDLARPVAIAKHALLPLIAAVIPVQTLYANEQRFIWCSVSARKIWDWGKTGAPPYFSIDLSFIIVQ
jgi:hypothetical protein